MHSKWKLAVLVMGAVGCVTSGTETPRPAQDAAPATASTQASSPSEVPQAAVEAGNAAITALQQRLFQRLSTELKGAGPTAAVKVCRDEAQALTAQVVTEQGIELGRTSHRLRNPNNAPREWVRPYLSQWAGKKAAEIQPAVVDLGDRVGLLRPLPTGELCTTCHGATEQLAPEVKATLQQAYPQDQAVGFSVGEIRGVVWAEVPKQRGAPKAP